MSDDVSFGALYITPLEVARAIGWTRKGDDANKRDAACQRAIRWLRKADALVERGGRSYTTRTLLKNSFPEVWEEMELARVSAEDE